MVRLVVEEQKEFPTLPKDSIVHLKVEKVELRTVNIPGRDPWDKLEFQFKILGIQVLGDGGDPTRFDGLIGETIYGNTSTRITNSQENKLRLWTEAILNRPVELDFEFDSDFFIGREVRAITSIYEKKAKNPVTGLPYTNHQVESLLPMGGGVGGGAPVAPTGYGAPQQDPWGQQQPAQQAPAQQWAPPPAQPQQDPWAAQQPQGQPAYAQQAPAQQAPPQQQAPAQDPWSTPGVQQPAQQYQQPVQQPPAQQAPPQQFEEPNF